MTVESKSAGDRFPEAYAVLRQAIADKAFPGCAFGMLASDKLVGGTVVVEDALGHFTYEPDSPKVAPDTIYDVASLTKVVATTALAMLMVQRGSLDLKTPVGELLPGFIIGRDPEQHGRLVTLRNLLAHNSGLPGYEPFFHTAATASAVLRGCLELPLLHPAGEHAEYSDPGFILLGKALEVLTGEPLAQSAVSQIFAPLGMTRSCFCPPPPLRPLIPPTEEDELFRQRRIQGEVQDEHAFLLQGAGGHAGLFSNAGDLLRFSQAILEPGPVSSDAMLSASNSLFAPATVEAFAQRQPPAGSSRALGWDTPSEDSSSGQFFSPSSIGHLGYSGCSLWIDRDAGVAIVLLTNRTWPHRESQLIRTVRPAFHDALRKAL